MILGLPEGNAFITIESTMNLYEKQIKLGNTLSTLKSLVSYYYRRRVSKWIFRAML